MDSFMRRLVRSEWFHFPLNWLLCGFIGIVVFVLANLVHGLVGGSLGEALRWLIVGLGFAFTITCDIYIAKERRP